MKKWLLTGLIVICTTCLCAGISACAYNGNNEHNWDKEWSHDDRGHWHECLDDCGLTNDYGSHDWKLLQTLDYPTCGDIGLGLYGCKVCDETKEDEISATGAHMWSTLESLEATCYSKGYVTRYCAVCDTTETAELPATEEHVFNESKWASAGDAGHGHPCYNRDAGCTATSEPVAHIKSETPTTIEPTDYDDGSISYDCIECGYKMDVVVLPATRIPVSMEFKISAYRNFTTGDLWAEYDKDPVVTHKDGEYYVTLFHDSGNPQGASYPYAVNLEATYKDESTGIIKPWGYGSTSGVSGYMVNKTTGELGSRLNGSTVGFIYNAYGSSSVLRCLMFGSFRLAFVFETGDVDRLNVNRRLTVYVNVTVVGYTTDISLTAEALPLVLDTEPIKYIENRVKHSEE